MKNLDLRVHVRNLGFSFPLGLNTLKSKSFFSLIPFHKTYLNYLGKT